MVVTSSTSSRIQRIRQQRGLSLQRRQQIVAESRGRETLRSKAARLGLQTEDPREIALALAERAAERGEPIDPSELTQYSREEQELIQGEVTRVNLARAQQADRQRQLQSIAERKTRELADLKKREADAARSSEEFRRGFNVSLRSGEIGYAAQTSTGRSAVLYRAADPSTASVGRVVETEEGARERIAQNIARSNFLQQGGYNVSLRTGQAARVSPAGQITETVADPSIASPRPTSITEQIVAQKELKARETAKELRERGTRAIERSNQRDIGDPLRTFDSFVGKSQIAQAKVIETAIKVKPIAEAGTEFAYDVTVRPAKGLYKGLTTPFVNLAKEGKFEAPLRGDPDFEAFVGVTTFAIPGAFGIKASRAVGYSLIGLSGYQSTKSLKEGDIKETTKGVLATGLAFFPAFQKSKVKFAQEQQLKQLALLEEKGFLKRPETIEGLKQAIKLQPFVRKAPDVPPKSIEKIIPEGLTSKEQAVVRDVLVKDTERVFGGSTLKIRDIRETKDIDIAAKPPTLQKIGIARSNVSQVLTKEVGQELKEVSPTPEQIVVNRESIGIRGEKGFDIKDPTRVRGFLFAQKPVKSPEGVPIGRLSEQYSRSLSGTLELRKGGKDIRDVILSGRELIGTAREKARQTNIPLVREYRLLQVRRAEKKFAKVEKAPEEIFPLIEKAGEEIPEIPRAPSDRVSFEEIIPYKDLFPQSKKGQFKVPSELPSASVRRKPQIDNLDRSKDIPSLRKEPAFRSVPRTLESSLFDESKFKSNRLKRSVITSSFFPDRSRYGAFPKTSRVPTPSTIRDKPFSRINASSLPARMPSMFDVPGLRKKPTPSLIKESHRTSKIPTAPTPSDVPFPRPPYYPIQSMTTGDFTRRGDFDFDFEDTSVRKKKKKKLVKIRSMLFPSLIAQEFNIEKSTLASRAERKFGGSLGFEVRPLSFADKPKITERKITTTEEDGDVKRIYGKPKSIRGKGGVYSQQGIRRFSSLPPRNLFNPRPSRKFLKQQDPNKYLTRLQKSIFPTPNRSVFRL